MSGSGGGRSRAVERVLEVEGRRWRVLEAWRTESGHGILYFLPLSGGTPGAEGEDGASGVATADRLDRRSPLEPGERLAEMEEEELAGRFARGRPLTDTERRFTAPDGRSWLAQGVGPVWAGSGVASGVTGVLFTCLEGPCDRLRATDGDSLETDPDVIVAAWRRAGGVETRRGG